MNAISKESGRLAWLAAILAGKRQRVVTLLRRLGDIGMPGALKPKMFRKFLRVLDQVAEAKDEEHQILSRIEGIEAKHRFRRKHKALKYAKSEPEPRWDAEHECEPEYARSTNTLLWILGFIAFVSGRKINQKKQDFTVD